MKIDIKRKISVSLRLTEEEAQVISAGLYALEFLDVPEQGVRADWSVRCFGDALAQVRDSLQTALGEAGLWPPAVREWLGSREYLAEKSLSADERLERDRRATEQWHRHHMEIRGLTGLSAEGEQVLQHLLCIAWRHPDRWVQANCPRPTQHKEEGQWFPHIDTLIALGRITPRIFNDQEGWIVPSTKEWRSVVRKRSRGSA